MKILYIVFIIGFFSIQCTHNTEKGIRKMVLNYFVDSLINTQAVNYDLCGTFHNELNDSFLKINLAAIDSLIDLREDKGMIDQYHNYGDKEIKTLLYNPKEYKINKSSSVSRIGSKILYNHLRLSAPLLTNNMDKAVMFFTGYNIKDKYAEGYIYIFININLNIQKWKIYAHRMIYPADTVSHNHVYSLIPPSEQKK